MRPDSALYPPRRAHAAAFTTAYVLSAALALAQQAGPVPSSRADDRQAAELPREPSAGDTDVLAAAGERYAAADYEGALAVLDRAKPADSDTATRAGIEQYRALCLIAMGSEKDAEGAIARLIAINPSFDVSRLDVSPSTRSVFNEVRGRVLPAMARDEFEAGKAAFDRKAYDEAARHLRRVLALANDAGDASPPAMNDIETLAQGFLDLATAESAAAKARAVVPALPPAPPVVPRHSPKIVDPAAVRQEIPSIPARLRQLTNGREGILQLTVNETGHVASATMLKPIHPVYDELLLQAARNWRYRPGTVDGKPVPRVITVVVHAG